VTRLVLIRALFLLCAIALGACGASLETRNPVPEQLVTSASLAGYPPIRFWGDDGASISSGALALQAKQVASAEKLEPSADARQRRFLVLSGGGSNGAFGAGVLIGWTANGGRPKFDIVTGISTGSLIAPFAFLGPSYDDELRQIFTGISGKDVYRKKGVLSIIGSESAADNTPLRNMVERYVTDGLIADVANEYAKGRRLLIGTTNIDAERPVVWDMGAIAASRDPGKKALFRDILIASASIPGIFPPIRLKVVADGITYDELHVDGGTSNQAFLMPANFSARDIDRKRQTKLHRTLYIVRNGKVAPEWSAVKPRLASIAGKSVSSLIKTQGIGDLYRMYVTSKRDGIDYNAVWVPADFTMKEKEPFDPTYMRALFNLGFTMGQNGIAWAKSPPD
jgi:predicted patatin/cPLA2 family phospholipase